MITVKNLTNSPFDLQSPKGTVRLPAFGQVSGEFNGEYLQLLKASLAVEVIEKTEDSADGLVKLRADYFEFFGKRAYHGWSAEELQEKIDAKLAE